MPSTIIDENNNDVVTKLCDYENDCYNIDIDDNSIKLLCRGYESCETNTFANGYRKNLISLKFFY